MSQTQTRHAAVAVKRYAARRSHKPVPRRERRNRGLREADLAVLSGMQWYLARVPSQKVFAAEQILDDAGLIVFAPEETRFRRPCGKVKTKREIRVALMPGYLMVAFPPGPVEWGKLLRFDIVKGLIGHDGRPLEIPFAQVERLLERHSAGEFRAPQVQQWMQTYREFAVGERVEVLDGPFEGHIVDVAELRGQNAVMVLQMFGSPMEVEIPTQHLGKTAA